MNTKLTILFILLSCFGYAQPMNQADAETLISIAEDRVINQDYHNALIYYQRAYQESKSWKVMLQLARMNKAVRDYYAAADWYDTLIKEYPDEADVLTRLDYARILKQCNRYDDASGILDWISGYTKDPNILNAISVEREGIRLLSIEKASDVMIIALNDRVNTPFSESAPFVNRDNSLIFTSWDTDEIYRYSDQPKDLKAQLYRSSYMGNEIMSDRIDFVSPVSKAGWHDTQFFESSDQQYRIWVRSKLRGNVLSRNEIFIQEKNEETWSQPILVDYLSRDFLTQHVQIAKLGKRVVLFFVTELNTGYGERDIYTADYLGNGEVSLPVNVGGGINTLGDESSPYFNGKQLYFSSNGHPGLGGLDVYASAWDGSNWSAPRHLARPINSGQDDWGYISSDNGVSYLVSNRPEGDSFRGPTCCDDLYQVSYTEKSKVNNPNTHISDTDTAQNQITSEDESISIISMPEVQWRSGYTSFMSSSETSLNELGNILKNNPNWIIELAVHTDSQGEPDRLVALSAERADIIKNYLISQDIDADRILPIGYGDRYILNECKRGTPCSDEQHAINNRAEYSVVDYLTDAQIFEQAGPQPPSIDLRQDSIHLGTIKKGAIARDKFVFTNNGDSELIIDLMSACDCTTLDWPKYEILPGESAEILFSYDSKDKEGFQKVTVDIVANTVPILTEAVFTVNVLK